MLADTTAARRTALVHALAAIGRELPAHALAAAADGRPAPVAAAAAARALSLDATDEELTALRAERAFDDATAAGIVLVPGARDAIAGLAARLRVVVVTRAPARVAERLLALAELDALVVGVVAAEQALAPKPSPAGHARALGRLSRLGAVDLRAVVALEDAAPGIEAAHAAGVHVVGVGPGARDATEPRAWLASLAGVTYDALVELLVPRAPRAS